MILQSRLWIALLVLASLTACGFQLRDAYGIPPSMARTFVDGSERSDVTIGLQRALRASGVNVTATPEAASAVLVLSQELSGQRVLSVGRDARVSEYEVFYSLTFSVRASEAEADDYIVEPQELRLTREYIYDATGVLGKSDEAALLREEMQRDLVRLIMYRLEAASPQ